MAQTGTMAEGSAWTEDLSPDDGVALGRALAVDHRRVAVARDSARGSGMMAEAVVSGLLFQGADVVDLGAVSVPAAVMHASDAECTVYIAGHVGKMGGHYLINPDGSLFRDNQLRHVEVLMQTPLPRPEPGAVGSRRRRHGVTGEYNRSVASGLDGGVKCSVVVDCKCGTASASLPQILNRLGAEVLAINAQDDPDMHTEAVSAGHAGSLENVVDANPGCIGIRVNHIGTLLKVLDEKGDEVPPEMVFALVAMYLRPASVAVPADSPSLIADAFLGRAGAEVSTPRPEVHPEERRVVLVKNSAGAVSDAIADGAELGYFRGCVVFGSHAAIGDGIRAAAVIVQMAGDNSVRGLCESFPEYHRRTWRRKCQLRPDDFRRAMARGLGEYAGRCTRYVDEYRIEMEEGWFLLRLAAADGETFIEVVAESRDRAYIIGLEEVANNLVDSILQRRRRYTTSSSISSPRELYARQLRLSYGWHVMKCTPPMFPKNSLSASEGRLEYPGCECAEPARV